MLNHTLQPHYSLLITHELFGACQKWSWGKKRIQRLCWRLCVTTCHRFIKTLCKSEKVAALKRNSCMRCNMAFWQASKPLILLFRHVCISANCSYFKILCLGNCGVEKLHNLQKYKLYILKKATWQPFLHFLPSYFQHNTVFTKESQEYVLRRMCSNQLVGWVWSD